MSDSPSYASYAEVVIGHDALAREPMTRDVVCGIIREAATKVEADVIGYLDVAQLRKMADPHPVIKVLVIAMARSCAYAALYGSNLPEGGGQVAKWRDEYNELLHNVVSGKYEMAFGRAVRDPRHAGRVKAV